MVTARRARWQPPEDLAVLVERHVVADALVAFCHVPAHTAVDLPALAEDGDESDRWSRADEPTVYLASDPGVVIAELGRHQDGGGDEPVEHRILRLELAVVRLLDLRRGEVAAALGLDEDPAAYLDRAFARAVGCAVRETGACEGIRVPSMAMLDHAERHCMVLFDDRIEGGFTTRVEVCEVIGEVRFGG